MHGTNQARPREFREDGKLQVADVWKTIQGEGPFAGMPCVFVRLTGCHLRCFFCDTEWDDDKDPYQTVDEIVERVIREAWSPERELSLVVITGGEPLRQDIESLVGLLTHEGFNIQFETAGSFYQPCLASDYVTVVISPKVAAVAKEFKDGTVKAHWKYVVTAEHGSDMPSTQINDKGGVPCAPPDHRHEVWYSPCDEGPGGGPATLANHRKAGELALERGHRVSMQMHKYLDMP